jgi:2-polyprenyl-3-methyl-5-hydroxy-6-metoxy-1,4-benzoquinol methylase
MDEQFSSLADVYARRDDYCIGDRPEMLRFIPEGISSVLDIGCSSGGFAGKLKNENPSLTVWGIEPNPKAAEEARRKLDNVICGVISADVPELIGIKFDCIVFNDVLEHLVNPEAALRACQNYLVDGGFVVASIPNILFFYQIAHILIKQDWKYQESGILDYTHLRFFTKKSIIRMFTTCGFQIDTIEGINGANGPMYWLFKLATLGLLKDWKYTQFGVRGIYCHAGDGKVETNAKI